MSSYPVCPTACLTVLSLTCSSSTSLLLNSFNFSCVIETYTRGNETDCATKRAYYLVAHKVLRTSRAFPSWRSSRRKRSTLATNTRDSVLSSILPWWLKCKHTRIFVHLERKWLMTWSTHTLIMSCKFNSMSRKYGKKSQISYSKRVNLHVDNSQNDLIDKYRKYRDHQSWNAFLFSGGSLTSLPSSAPIRL